MKLHNRHERLVAATPTQIARLVSDLDLIWPTEIAPAPQPLGDGCFELPPMRWQEIDRDGSIRAFRVVEPPELQGQHWFELEPLDEQTIVRHTVEGEAVGHFATIWREGIEPVHDRIVEALLDRIETALAAPRR